MTGEERQTGGKLFMNVQSDRRKWAALFVVVLLGSVSVLYAGNEETRVDRGTQEQNAPPEMLGRRGIRGADIQVAEEDIRNPFTALHETAAEDSQAAAVPREKKLTPEKMEASQRLPLPELPERQTLPKVPGKPERSEELELCGIMQGRDGKVALLRLGSQTAVLSLGETFRDWMLIHMEEGMVILRKDWQDKYLYLRSY